VLEFLNVIRQHNSSQWDGPLYLQFGRSNARMQSFHLACFVQSKRWRSKCWCIHLYRCGTL